MFLLVTALWFQDSVIEQVAEEWTRIAEKIQPSVVSVTASRETLIPYNDTKVKAKVPIEFAGVIVSADGWILTDASGVAQADLENVKVRLADGRTFDAKEKRVDRFTALALIRIDAPELRPVEFAPAAPKAGQPIMLCGNAYGMTGSVILGNVSGVGRSVRVGRRQVDDLLQLSLQAVPGDGGALVADPRGRLAGVVVGGYTPLRAEGSVAEVVRFLAAGGRGSMTLTFAVPADVAQFVASRLSKQKEVQRGWIGFTLEPLNDAERAQLPSEHRHAARVKTVVRRGPAADAGLAPGAVIVGLNGKPLGDLRALRLEIWSLEPGRKVPVTLLDGAKPVNRELTVEVERTGVDGGDESDF